MSSIYSITSAIKLPSNQLRNIPKLNSNVAWKASDYENFFLYCTPVLEKFLPEEIYKHFCKFVKILTTLCQFKISQEELEDIEISVREFMQDFPKYYGPRMWRYNVHVVAHLVTMVELYGSLYETAAFDGENAIC